MAKTETAKRAAGSKTAKSSRASKTSRGRKPNAAFMKPVQPRDELPQIVGDKPLPRTELTKKLWSYIKKNGLQDQKNKRMIKRSEEHTSELQSHSFISYAVFCLKK